jgi:putative glycosyltransferase (TIGR04372 family)
MLIDYSFDDSRSDFLDYWLFASGIGTISTGTGPDNISLLHKKPILFLNALPLSLFYSFADCIWVPKNLKWKSNNDELNLNE